MIEYIIAMLVLLNPFAMFLYLQPVMKALSKKEFLKVLTKATIISLSIFTIFLLTRELFFEALFNIRFESFQIFGGIVLFSMAYYFIVRGEKALIILKEDLEDLANDIALPFMVGAGTISLTIIMSETHNFFGGLTIVSIALGVNYVLILFLQFIRNQFDKRKMRVAFDKNMEILLKLSGFFLGAIGIDMIITGITAIGFV
ncbi:MAG: MarC family protein [Candidatus Woesearchaeota archaeon]